MRLIDANKAKAELLRIARDVHDCCGFYDGIKVGYQSAADRLDTIPVVEERKHGRWEGGGAYYCSNCNAYAATDVFGGGLDITEQHYCYNCGAIMDGKAICDD